MFHYFIIKCVFSKNMQLRGNIQIRMATEKGKEENVHTIWIDEIGDTDKKMVHEFHTKSWDSAVELCKAIKVVSKRV